MPEVNLTDSGPALDLQRDIATLEQYAVEYLVLGKFAGVQRRTTAFSSKSMPWFDD